MGYAQISNRFAPRVGAMKTRLPNHADHSFRVGYRMEETNELRDGLEGVREGSARGGTSHGIGRGEAAGGGSIDILTMAECGAIARAVVGERTPALEAFRTPGVAGCGLPVGGSVGSHEGGAMSDQLMEAVERYEGMGLSVLPLREDSKKPTVKWEFMYDAAGFPCSNRSLFQPGRRRPKAGGVGLLLGAVSDGLACRDFDTHEGYQHWAGEHESLAKILPSVRTRRGAHVYFTLSEPIEGVCIRPGLNPDGELKLSRSYAVAPPTQINDHTYEWFVSLKGTPPAIDPVGAGLITHSQLYTVNSVNSDNTVNTVNSSRGRGQHSADPAAAGDHPETEIEQWISATLPRGAGQRNAKVFAFARCVRSRYPADTPAGELLPLVKEWHKRATPYIRTKDFPTTAFDFLRAFRDVEVPADKSVLSIASYSADLYEPPPALQQPFSDDPRFLWFACFCYAMGVAAGGDFFLSCRKAAEFLPVSHTIAYQWLDLLVSLRSLERVHPGIANPSSRKAAEFRWIGEPLRLKSESVEAESGGMDLRAEADPSSLAVDPR